MVAGATFKIAGNAVPEADPGDEGGVQVQPEPEDLLHSREPLASTRQWGEGCCLRSVPTEPLKRKLPQARFSWKAVVQCERSAVGVKKAPSRSIRQAGLEGKSNGLSPVRASSVGDSKDREPENCSVVAFS